MTTMVEKVVERMKAGLAAHDEVYFRDDGDRCVVDGRVDMRALARAAIEAMKEPTDLMGLGLPADYKPGSHSATQIWQSMIDAALNEEAAE